MSRKLIGCGVVGLAFCVAAGGAQAKLIRYEIDGKRYSYSSNNIQQTREARRRIEAASAATAAEARAEAERTGNPLVKIFGSRAQREAAAARTRLQETMASRAAPDDDADLESTSSLKRNRAEAPQTTKGVKARAERRQALREARLERRRLASARAQRRAALNAETQHVARKEVAPAEARHRAEPASKLPAVEIIPVGSSQPSKNSLPETGSMESAASLMEFVNQVRKALP
jgi:serine phosphatase RsbU (regulator of sigma subunit)